MTRGLSEPKRVNSKEDLNEEERQLHRQRLRKSLHEFSSRSKVFSSARINDITEALANKAKRERAIQATTNAHSSEALSCYLAIFDWEAMTDGDEKNAVAQTIFSRFVQEGPEALCLQDAVRSHILSCTSTIEEQTEAIAEIKKHALNDLRFNTVLLRALGGLT